LGREGLARLRSLAASSPLLAAARGRGLYWGLEVTGSAALPAAEAADRLLYGCLRRGLSFKLAGPVVTLCPPLTIGRDQLGRAFAILESAAAEVAGGP
ncbi:MAG: aspartate aminotransferase family protein, partial [Actinobacteria bacterium]|nr:aspartate aminotransferase family protein [Actinomycetota bacterium]